MWYVVLRIGAYFETLVQGKTSLVQAVQDLANETNVLLSGPANTRRHNKVVATLTGFLCSVRIDNRYAKY